MNIGDALLDELLRSGDEDMGVPALTSWPAEEQDNLHVQDLHVQSPYQPPNRGVPEAVPAVQHHSNIHLKPSPHPSNSPASRYVASRPAVVAPSPRTNYDAHPQYHYGSSTAPPVNSPPLSRATIGHPPSTKSSGMTDSLSERIKGVIDTFDDMNSNLESSKEKLAVIERDLIPLKDGVTALTDSQRDLKRKQSEHEENTAKKLKAKDQEISMLKKALDSVVSRLALLEKKVESANIEEPTMTKKPEEERKKENVAPKSIKSALIDFLNKNKPVRFSATKDQEGKFKAGVCAQVDLFKQCKGRFKSVDRSLYLKFNTQAEYETALAANNQISGSV